jgi:hypothetical protein
MAGWVEKVAVRAGTVWAISDTTAGIGNSDGEERSRVGNVNIAGGVVGTSSVVGVGGGHVEMIGLSGGTLIANEMVAREIRLIGDCEITFLMMEQDGPCLKGQCLSTHLLRAETATRQFIGSILNTTGSWDLTMFYRKLSVGGRCWSRTNATYWIVQWSRKKTVDNGDE